MLYTTDFEKSPPIPSGPQTNFRNEVIHNGKIPTREEAVKYGQAMLDIIRSVLQEAKKKYPKGVDRTIGLHLAHCLSAKDKGIPVSTMGISTIISLSFSDSGHDERPLEKAIQELRQWPELSSLQTSSE
jgi:hypothetical protein